MKNPDGWYTGIIKFKDLPDNVWLNLKPSFKEFLIKTIRNETDYLFLLAKKLNEPLYLTNQSNHHKLIQAYTLCNFISGKCVSLRLIRKLSKFLVKRGHKEFRLEIIQKYVRLLKSGKGGKLS